MQSSKFEKQFPYVDEFIKKHRSDLTICTHGQFKKEYPKVKISDAAFYSRRRKALGLPSYSQTKAQNMGRNVHHKERLYKQFFSISKNETTDNGIDLLQKFIDRINTSNYQTRFEIVELIVKIDGQNKSQIEVREFK